jgi:hypothetical protein
MPISAHLLSRSRNRYLLLPCWATIDDWLMAAACEPLSAPLVDFEDDPEALMRAGTTNLNWFLMDLLGLRQRWLDGGWRLRDEIWLLINPMRYRILRHPPRRPFPLDVRDYLARVAPRLLHETLSQHPYFALAPTLFRAAFSDYEAERRAKQAPWHRIAVINDVEQIMGMVWSPGEGAGTLPPIMKPPQLLGNVTTFS